MRVMANYAIKPTPEQALRTNWTKPPARLIAALCFTMRASYRFKRQGCRVIGDVAVTVSFAAADYFSAVSWKSAELRASFGEAANAVEKGVLQALDGSQFRILIEDVVEHEEDSSHYAFSVAAEAATNRLRGRNELLPAEFPWPRNTR
jgi:hypothetical protein